MKEAAAAIAKLDSAQIASILSGNMIELKLPSGSAIQLAESDITIQREEKQGMPVATEGGITIALDTELDEALLNEGYARESVSKVQNMRKDMGLDVSDRIEILFKSDSEIENAVKNFREYICNETLSVSIKQISQADESSLNADSKCDLNGHASLIFVRKF
ncbi:Isoleucine--tRNA ligase [bioreactor metagenome]|uniref:Isoleucine--tRNA ligase n=1 Tax=bioreactor metagenome TaxID=1076179 RepID=A0A645IQR5_9ZZZZ